VLEVLYDDIIIEASKLYLLTLLQLVLTPSAAESWVYAEIMKTVGCDNWEESKLTTCDADPCITQLECTLTK